GVFGSSCTAAILSRPYPLWVISGHSAHSVQCPLYPQKRTLPHAIMSTHPKTAKPKKLIHGLIRPGVTRQKARKIRVSASASASPLKTDMAQHGCGRLAA